MRGEEWASVIDLIGEQKRVLVTITLLRDKGRIFL